MRLSSKKIRRLVLKNAAVQKDGEGVTITTYGAAKYVYGEVYPAGGKLQSEMYGQSVNSMFNIRLAGKYAVKTAKGHTDYIFGGFSLREGDAFCLHVDESSHPDYRIIAIKPYDPLQLEVQRI